jgi:23S rRNA (cytosine1962-C5)-methyltransferase
LLDFGAGRKLERFAGVILNRPCPTADSIDKSRSELWEQSTARFRGPRIGDGSWSPAPQKWLPLDWHYAHGDEATFKLQLEALPSGQVGVFPEQRTNWDWIARQVAKSLPQNRPPRGGQARFAPKTSQNEPVPDGSGIGSKSQAVRGRALRVLNLFAYTGGSTLAAAAAGAEVVHIDAAQNIVDHARDNAEISGLADRPIRWIA